MPYLASWERSARRKGKIEGKVEGYEEGMEKKAKEDAKKMIDRGFDLEVVMDISGLSKEEIMKF
jgi:predicted transposase/invertase (TIGR01784 family)